MARNKSKTKPLAVLSEEDRKEYSNRMALVRTQSMQLDASKLYLELWQDMMIQKYGLPDKFDINLDTGRVTLREEPHAQNGRV